MYSLQAQRRAEWFKKELKNGGIEETKAGNQDVFILWLTYHFILLLSVT